MEQFSGFDRDTFRLLAENQFNDSKVYYESVKEEIKNKAIVPMRNICSLLADELFEIDEQMNLIPTKMVSRIRRDTRRAKTQNMYRANLWALFIRNKYEWKYQPCMWFEIMPGSYTMGIGLFHVDSGHLDNFRQVMLENQDEFRKALKKVHSVGAVDDIERYAKEKPGDIAKDLKPYYNAKSLFFIRYESDMESLFNGKVLDELRESIRAFAPMYRFLIKVMEKTISEKGKDYGNNRL